MSLRVTLSQVLVEQLRYRTRKGMKTALRRGKATTCLACGYRIKLEYDADGELIPGLREVDRLQAEIVQENFRTYADGMSPSAIAVELNRKGIRGPRSAAWRDTAIRGHVDRGTGILNNKLYLGGLSGTAASITKIRTRNAGSPALGSRLNCSTMSR
ncbi:recombinase family protein [Rhizobium helianthi]|uniref:Recombinase family protein n=1 Tax=Rhizobium helianthi TaxID=1132695 RepID=A0ABW4M888_9HYPH